VVKPAGTSSLPATHIANPIELSVVFHPSGNPDGWKATHLNVANLSFLKKLIVFKELFMSGLIFAPVYVTEACSAS
jgi:hypothetical protein